MINQNIKETDALLDVISFENPLDTVALLKILALGNAQIENGQVTSAAKAFAQIRRRDMAAI